MKIHKYPDGASYAEVKVRDCSDGKYEIFKVNSYEDLWHLNQFVDACNARYNYRPSILIPNLFDGQADRRFANNQSSGLKLVCNLLNGMAADFKIFHPHNPEVVEALMDNIKLIDNLEFIERVFARLANDENIKNIDDSVVLMSSDAGGFKPLMKLSSNLDWKGEIYSASKARDPKVGKITQIVDRQNFQGKDILIIDDISVYGGTFKGLAKLLRKANCGKLYLAVSHMTVQNLGKDNVCGYFDKVFTTNSKYDSYYCSYKVRDVGPIQTMEYIPDNLEIIKQF